MAMATTQHVFLFPLCILLWSNVGVFVNGVDGSWTIWYNRYPDDIGDDQSWTTIKDRGYTVCGNEKPELAECRVVGSGVTFTESNALVIAPDHLSEPCTKNGLVCYNNDAGNGQCQDYEVRFFCPYTGTDADNRDKSANYGLVALAAGLSVLIPLLCVVVLQCIRQVRIKRALRARSQVARDHFSNMGSVPVDPSTYTSPPTYESLFSNGQSFPSGTGRDALIQSDATNSSSIDLSHVNEGFSPDDATQTGVYQISSGRVLPTDNTGSHVTNIRRFPGMHLSMEDIILLNGGDQRTPPPAYNDAMVIVGPIPPKYSDVQKEQAPTS